jgi:2-oxoglutarate ferredoxin oxidoreductase subunit alpha
MVFGASVAGKRSMTSSSSPGISLKQEGLSYLAANELPAVVVNVQRGGPGLGNISASQADYFQATKGGGHGDYHCIVLAPDSVQETHDLTVQAFGVSDRYRTPALVLTDGLLGQMMEEVRLHEGPPPPVPPKPWALTGAEGRKPQIVRSLYLPEGDLERHNRRLQAKYRRIEREFCRWEETRTRDAEVLVVAYGTSARVGQAVVRAARAEGIRAGLLRPITLWPYPAARLAALAGRLRSVVVLEMSSGQMLEDVERAVSGRVPVLFHGWMGGAMPDEAGALRVLRRAARAPARPAPRGSRER